MAGRVGFRVCGSCVFDRQGVSESHLCISKRFVSSKSNDIDVLEIAFSLDKSRANNNVSISMRSVFLCLMKRLMTKPQEAPK